MARSTPNIKDLIKPLEETIRTIFIPNLTSQNAPNDKERQLLALPARLGGLGISNPSERSTLHYSTCETITGPLVSLILDQSDEIGPEVKRDQVRMKSNAQKFCRQIEERTASDLKETLPTNLQNSLTICSEKGTSSWLSALPITEHMDLHYTKEPSGMPSASATVGVKLTYHPTVFVESSSQLNMRLAVPGEAFHRYTAKTLLLL